MSGRLILDLPNPSLTAAGKVDSGATLTYYQNGTTTLQSIYADAGLVTPLANPLPCNAAGRFVPVWATDGTSYSVKWSPTGATPITFDNIVPLGATANSNVPGFPAGITSTVAYPALSLVPVEAFGAVGDAYQVSDVAITSGLKALTSAGGNFTSFAGTKSVCVNNAGASTGGLTTDLVTTATFVSTSLLTLTAAAGATVTGEKATIGTDNAVALQAALDSSLAPNVMAMNGLYYHSVGLVLPSGKNIYGSGTPYAGDTSKSGLISPGSIYAHQANIPTDPVAGLGGVATITSATQSGNIATYTLSASLPAWLTVGAIVNVNTVLPAGYNFTGKATAINSGSNQFSMLVPTTGLGSSTRGGFLISQANKKYAVRNSDTLLTTTNVYNLNITGCNPLNTVAWGCLWPNTGNNQGAWQFNFYSCNFSGWVGRHLMWANGVNYVGCIMQGAWSGDMFSMPGGLAYTGVVQKVNDVGCIASQIQNSYGRCHDESNGTGTASVFSAWNMTGGSLEGGYALGDFTGMNYHQNTVHYESLTAPSALFVNIPSTSSGTFTSPDTNITGGQQSALSVAGGATGQSSWLWIQGGTVGTKSIWSDTAIVNSKTVSTLPTPTGRPGFAIVTDSNATVAAGIGNVVVGGGANIVPVYSDGTNWRIG